MTDAARPVTANIAEAAGYPLARPARGRGIAQDGSATTTNRTVGVLLAAGAGTRFAGATHKLLADIDGRPVLARSLENMAAARLPAALVVTGAALVGGLVPPEVTVLVNPDWRQGQATSLTAGIRWAGAHGFDAVVVGLGDQPGVATKAWRAVASAGATPIAVATYGGRRGHPVRLHRDVWDLLPTTGDTGARGLMAQSPQLVAEVACHGDPSDIDTVEDLARWRRLPDHRGPSA